jgi:hypothetical protein
MDFCCDGVLISRFLLRWSHTLARAHTHLCLRLSFSLSHSLTHSHTHIRGIIRSSAPMRPGSPMRTLVCVCVSVRENYISTNNARAFVCPHSLTNKHTLVNLLLQLQNKKSHEHVYNMCTYTWTLCPIRCCAPSLAGVPPSMRSSMSM